MKKINSNSYAGRWIAAGLAPLALAGILEVAKNFWHAVIPAALVKILLAAGAVILLGFGVLLAVELVQDRRLNAYYRSRTRTVLPLNTGFYECQACGYQKVGKEDRSCCACGVAFENRESIP